MRRTRDGRRRPAASPALSDGLTSSAFEFDELGRAIAHRRPDGTRLRCEYDRCGRRVAIDDPVGGDRRGSSTRPAGRLLREIVRRPAASTRTSTTAAGASSRASTAPGRRWEFRYDADGALVERSRARRRGRALRVRRRGPARRARRTRRRASRRYAYDAAGRTSAVTDRDAGTRRFAYDAAGRLVAATDANGARDALRLRRARLADRGRRPARRRRPRAATTRSAGSSRETDPLGRTTTLDLRRRRADRRARSTARVARRAGPTTPPAACSSYGAGRRGADHDRARRARPRDRDRRARLVRSTELRWDAAGRLVERRRGDARDALALRRRRQRAALGYPDGTRDDVTPTTPAAASSASTHPALGAIELERDAAGRLVGARRATACGARWRLRRRATSPSYTLRGRRRRAAPRS